VLLALSNKSMDFIALNMAEREAAHFLIQKLTAGIAEAN
jgi:hypothetical protein